MQILLGEDFEGERAGCGDVIASSVLRAVPISLIIAGKAVALEFRCNTIHSVKSYTIEFNAEHFRGGPPHAAANRFRLYGRYSGAPSPGSRGTSCMCYRNVREIDFPVDR